MRSTISRLLLVLIPTAIALSVFIVVQRRNEVALDAVQNLEKFRASTMVRVFDVSDTNGLAAFARTEFATHERALLRSAWKPREELLLHVVLGSLRIGKLAAAEHYARELVDASVEQVVSSRRFFSIINFWGNFVMAQVALENGNLATAETHLLRVAESGNSHQLSATGVTKLVEELLKRGRKDGVVEYLKRCRTLPNVDAAQLAEWIEQIESGVTPKFNTGPWY